MKLNKLLLNFSLYCLILNHLSLAQAQIAPDGTLSTNVTTENNLNFTINGGNRAGNNLFHSFREFSVPTGGEAFFNNAGDIQNIFSRVTGGSISNIDGLIRANGTANLFLLNPSGIIFGPNARLNIGGSFLASTARSLIFSDGTQFSATNAQTSPLLTINVPVGLQYGSKAEPIRVQGSSQLIDTGGATTAFGSDLINLQVNPGNSLTLAGGNVIVDGGILQAPGGRIEIGGLVEEGTIAIASDGSLSFPAGVQRGDVSILNKSGINVLAGGGGNIAINARNLEISDSLLTTGIATELGEPGAQAGNIVIDATAAINITASRIENNINPVAIGDGGDIIIQAGSTFTTDTASLSTGTFGEGTGGNLIIAGNSVALTNGTSVDSITAGFGDSGNIAISSKSDVAIVDSQIQSDILKDPIGAGNAGNIFVQANGLVNIFNSQITSSVPENATGNGGIISIEGGSISLNQNNPTGLETITKGDGDAGNIILTAKDGIDITTSVISSDTFGAGNAGIVIIKAGGAIAISKTDINSQVQGISTGESGIVSIDGKSVSLSDNTQVQTSTKNGPGNAGLILINAQDFVTITGSKIESSAWGETGDAGALSITSDGSIFIGGGTLIVSSNFAGGNAGNIDLIAKDWISIVNSNIFSDAFNNETQSGDGFAGIITIKAGNSFTLSSQSKITADSFGDPQKSGTGLGIISIDAGSVLLSNLADLSTNTYGNGDAGFIAIKAQSVSITDASTVGSSSFGTGNSGDITINATGLVTIDNSNIGTNSLNAAGDAGNIAIAGQSIQLTNLATLQSSNFVGGNAGKITVDAKENISIFNSSIFSDTFNSIEDQAGGFAGNIFINAGNALLLDSFSQITAESFSKLAESDNFSGLGFISINAKAISLTNLSRIGNNTYSIGSGGDIDIQTQTLFVGGGSAIQASTFGAGVAGSIEIKASDSIILSGVAPLSFDAAGDLVLVDERGNPLGGNSSGIFASTNLFNSGPGGNIAINTNNLQIADGAVIAATTRSIKIGGNIEVNVNNLQLTGGGQILASAFNIGNAGSIRIIAQDRVTISGIDPTYQQRFDTIAQRSSPLTAELFLEQDGPSSGLFVNNRGGGQGGDINVSARSIRLDNRAAITADTASGKGGNIALGAENLIVLRRNSNISTTAGRAGAGGDGGNIEIVTPNLVALENSDITANAFEGKGGRVSITAQGIFGAQSRTEETSKSDITAISQVGGPQLSGTVELNTPDVDPSSGLIELPQTVVDITGLIDRRCSPNAEQSTFVATGRGGLPPSPDEPLSNNAYLVDLVDINPQSQGSRGAGEQRSRKESPPMTEIVEAQGWIINDRGQVVLVANPPTVTPHRSGLIPVECHVR